MKRYVVLLRGINVGGKNKISMRELKQCLEAQGFEDVATYIQSGNIILSSKLDAEKVSKKIERTLQKEFKLDSAIIRAVALAHTAYKKIVANAPRGFGKDNAKYRYNVIFLIGVSPKDAMRQLVAREGVDKIWEGNHVIYYRLPSLTSPNATKSHLNKVTQQPIYPSITIRNWNTTKKLLDLLEKAPSK